MVTLGDFRVTWKRFGVTRGSLWSILGPLGGTLGSLGSTLGPLGGHFGTLWAHFGVTFRCMRVVFCHCLDFQKIQIFPMNFNDFTYLLASLDITWVAFWGDFGALWTYFGATLG